VKYLMMVLLALLLIAHQDYWNWNNATLVFGFLPLGLFYHLCISQAAATVWLIGVTFAWPKAFTELDDTISQSKLAQSVETNREVTQ
jgi:hypothetical protein